MQQVAQVELGCMAQRGNSRNQGCADPQLFGRQEPRRKRPEYQAEHRTDQGADDEREAAPGNGRNILKRRTDSTLHLNQSCRCGPRRHRHGGTRCHTLAASPQSRSPCDLASGGDGCHLLPYASIHAHPRSRATSGNSIFSASRTKLERPATSWGRSARLRASFIVSASLLR